MYQKLLFGLILSAIFATTGFAQSSSKSNYPASGSASRGSSSTAKRAAAAKRKMEQEADREYLKVAKKIAKSEFAAIKLTRPQLETLKEAVAVNYQAMTNLDNGMVQFIPADKRKALQRSYKKSIKEGLAEEKAMSMSMQAVGMSEMSQKKVMDLNMKKTDLMATVTSSITSILTAEQAQALKASMAKEMKDVMEKDVIMKNGV